LGFRALTPVFDGSNEDEIESELARAWMVDQAWNDAVSRAWEWIKTQEQYTPENIKDDEEVRLLYLEQRLGTKGIDVYRMASDRIYARHENAREWLREKGYNPEWNCSTLRVLNSVLHPSLTEISKPFRSVCDCGWKISVKPLPKSPMTRSVLLLKNI